ncbi:Major facilitator superfamily [Macrophomina phaseolina MS6]|uniref:Major facilitator superfamily n=1 Tax=Macrophomina phaseolina (strain MS6) TaxID=1126212 RepID=K2S142_MACPH|nr:Major facilitator superfamily [Macrophomina phaseolina MS6]
MESRETTRLLPPRNDRPVQRTPSYIRNVLCVIATLLGALMASADESLMISMYSIVGSDLRRLHEASWLLISYNLGYSIALPICGKLAQIYGRKNPLLISYALFTIGNLWVGIAGSLWHAVAGRLVTGLGGAGLIGLVSVIITDVAHPRQVALFRSYVTVITTIGRSAGPPLGAMLSDIMGWRWSFLSQCPVSVCCAIFISLTLPTNLSPNTEAPEQERKEGLAAVRQIDFSGIFAFILAVSTFILLIDLGGDRLPWTHPLTISLGIACVSSTAVFLIIEKFWAANPLTPLSLLRLKAGGGFCVIQVLVFLGRFATLTNLVPFFIYTQGASNTMAALCMVPSSVGAAVGGLASGITFTRFPRYKLPTLLLTAISIAAYAAIILRWTRTTSSTAGNDEDSASQLSRHPLELSYILVVGAAFGWTLSAQFVGLSRATPRRLAAEGITAYYLAQQVGSIVGTNVAAKVVRGEFRSRLRAALREGNEDVVEGIIKDSRFYQKLPASERRIVRAEYLAAFRLVPVLSICANVAAVGVQLLLPETHGHE